MNLITITKLIGAERLHKLYAIENKEDFNPSFEFEQLTDNTIQFPNELEETFKNEVEAYKNTQLKTQIKHFRKLNILNPKEAKNQKSKQWFEARIGIITASNTPFDINGNPIPTFTEYINKKVADRIRLENKMEFKDDGFKSKGMQEGNNQESDALIEYEKATGNTIQERGLLYHGSIGASPDGLAFTQDFEPINIEVKSVYLNTYISEKMDEIQSRKYKAQMQTQMYLLNVDTTHFIVQCQEKINLPIIIRTIKRDEEYICNMIKTIELFEREFKIRYDAIMEIDNERD